MAAMGVKGLIGNQRGLSTRVVNINDLFEWPCYCLQSHLQLTKNWLHQWTRDLFATAGVLVSFHSIRAL